MFANNLQRKKITDLVRRLASKQIKVIASYNRMSEKEVVIRTTKGDFIVDFLGECRVIKKGVK